MGGWIDHKRAYHNSIIQNPYACNHCGLDLLGMVRLVVPILLGFRILSYQGTFSTNSQEVTVGLYSWRSSVRLNSLEIDL